MNQATDNKGKDGVLKTLAIGGFVGLIIIIAWLGIQLISFMPTAFSSLASLANSVYNYKPVELIVVSDKTTANSGESFNISWNKPTQIGSFAFAYDCVEGVSVEIRAESGKIETVNCNEEFDLDDATTLALTVKSEKERFSEVPYTVSFIPNKAAEASATKDGVITVVNAMISPVDVSVATSTDNVNGEKLGSVDQPKDVVVNKPEPVKPSVATTTTPAKPATPAVTKPKVPAKPVAVIPVSNPNGFTDIGVRSIGVGYMDANNKFIHAGVMDNDVRGSIQFEIKNFGTRTSDSFTYTATLPGGVVYTSTAQAGLKPNERIVATLGFDASTLKGVNTFNVKVTVSGDSNTNNNQFVSAVQVND